MRLWGIHYRVCGVYSPEPRDDVYCFKLNFKISKLAYYNGLQLLVLKLTFIIHYWFLKEKSQGLYHMNQFLKYHHHLGLLCQRGA